MRAAVPKGRFRRHVPKDMSLAAVPKGRRHVLGDISPSAVPKGRFLRHVLTGMFCGALLASGCAAEPELEGAALRAQAQELWRARCATCHGPVGRGDGPTGRGLDPRPRDFQDAGWQARVDDARLRRVIVEGGAALGLSAEMAANADLAARPAMVGALIEIVRGFAVQARDTK